MPLSGEASAEKKQLAWRCKWVGLRSQGRERSGRHWKDPSVYLYTIHRGQDIFGKVGKMTRIQWVTPHCPLIPFAYPFFSSLCGFQVAVFPKPWVAQSACWCSAAPCLPHEKGKGISAEAVVFPLLAGTTATVKKSNWHFSYFYSSQTSLEFFPLLALTNLSSHHGASERHKQVP